MIHRSTPQPSSLTVHVETKTNPDSVWIHFHGEADISTHHYLQASLAKAPLDGVATVHLGLANFTFCDVATFREIATFVRHAERKGHSVTIHNASPILRKLNELNGGNNHITFDSGTTNQNEAEREGPEAQS